MTAPGSLLVETHLTARDLRAALEDDVRSGLRTVPRSIPPVWFYDEEGSRLFEAITALPEYYPTRAERRLLAAHAPAIARTALADTLVELGAGACDKTRVLLDAMRANGPLARYVPFDVSDEFLRAAAAGLMDDYEGLAIHTVVGDFHRHLDRIPLQGRRLVAFLGGTIGNLDPEARRRFFFDLNCTMAATDHFLLGADLVKDPERIVAAYDDASGVTAAFNRNVLNVLNRGFGARFDVDHFEHVARWNAEEQWIEMRLRSTRPQVVEIDQLGMALTFSAGEEILTEISAKFTPDRLERELAAADFVVDGVWGAEDGEYMLVLAHPYCELGPDPVISARGLTKRYGGTLAVDHLSFDVLGGVVTGFLGPNGSGKSTTMRMIMGLDAPDEGAVTINAQPYRDLRWPLREVGGLLEAKATHPGRSARDHLWAMAQTNDIPRARVDEVLDLVGLHDVAKSRAGKFSLGMGQRLGIAAALLGDPGVLLFDEPVNGLDPEGIRWVRNLLRSLAHEGRAVFVSSHLMSEMALTADHLVVIGRGRLIAQTSIADFVSANTTQWVQVRSPGADALAQAVAAAGGRVDRREDGALAVHDLDAASIGDLAAARGIALHELTPQSASLEEAFMGLTSDSVEFRGGGLTPAGPGYTTGEPATWPPTSPFVPAPDGPDGQDGVDGPDGPDGPDRPHGVAGR